MSRSKYQRCCALCSDGSRCSRFVTDPDALQAKQPYCHLHGEAGPPGKLFTSKQKPLSACTPEEILRRLMFDADASIRLRAVSEWLDVERKRSQGCAACEARRDDSEKMQAFFAKCDVYQRERLHDLVGSWKALKAEVCGAVVEAEPDVVQSPTPSSPEPEPVVTMQRPATAPSTPTQLDGEPAKPYALPRELWDEVGLFEDNGVVTHALGDDHAAKILNGEISFEDAAAHQRGALRRAEAMNAQVPIWHAQSEGKRPYSD